MSMRNSQISESSGFFGGISASVPFKSLLTKSKLKGNSIRRSKLRSGDENEAPVDPNIQMRDPPLSPTIAVSKKSPSKVRVGSLAESVVQDKVDIPDPPVKVLVRIKPTHGLGIGETLVTKVSKNSLSAGDRNYTFDSVLDSNATQGDVYQSIGAPLVKNALSGYNTSIVAYGQTGSGKTYTMWGPPSAMLEGAVSDLHGIVPRIFQNLFTEIQKEQDNSDGKQVNYQCRCSFLEVYDDKIGDLLDPTQRDLEIKDDVKSGFYVENLTEEYVTSCEEVNQMLIKGLSNRKTGATHNNSKSSRSHIMFTCIIESWSKESSSKCFGSSRISRISLVDLAGFGGNALDDSSKQHATERKYIRKSTSQLGYLVNILAEGNNTAEVEEIPYRNSRLTHLLRESFGGNAKLSILCAVSPDKMNSSETISTLRFGVLARLMKNKPVVNEISEDDVNDLSDQIRQLKEELMRARSSASNDSFNSNQGFFRRGKARESLNQLRLSLNRSLLLPRIENERENLSINEDDVKELKLHIDSIRNSHEENSRDESDNGLLYSAEGCETGFTCEHYLSCSEESEYEEINSTQPVNDSINSISSLSINRCNPSSVLQGPVLSESPKIKNSQRKSSEFLPIEEDTVQDSNIIEPPQLESIRSSSLRSSRIFSGSTNSLAASLHRGMQVIESHQKDSAPSRSSVSFSFEHLALKPCLSAEKINASVQTSREQKSVAFLCTKCQGTESNEVDNSSEDSKKDLAMAMERQQELKSVCQDQAAEIEHLKKTLEKCKCMSDQTNFTSMKNKPNPISEDENDIKLLTWNNEENSEMELIKEKCEITEIQDSSCGAAKSFTLEERESLLKEIEVLKNKLQLRSTDATARKSTDKIRSSLLSQSIQLRKSSASSQPNSWEDFEKERQRWMEMESDWISLTDELRIEIESNRRRAEKVEMELALEKKCTEELDDVVKRSVVNHARMIEHYADLQEKYDDLEAKHRAIMQSIAEVKRAASKAGAKGRHGARFAKALSAELSALRVERERERELLRRENRSLKIQLKDTAEAVHAAGELLVRLREAEEAASQAEGKNAAIQEVNDKLRKQMEKLKRKHKMEMITMKQYLAESRLPEAALRSPIYRQDSDHDDTPPLSSLPQDDDDQAWRAEFGAIYQQHY